MMIVSFDSIIAGRALIDNDEARAPDRSGSPVQRRPCGCAGEEATEGSHRSPTAAGRSKPAIAKSRTRRPKQKAPFRTLSLVTPGGFEPPTNRTGICHSIQLNYGAGVHPPFGKGAAKIARTDVARSKTAMLCDRPDQGPPATWKSATAISAELCER